MEGCLNILCVFFLVGVGNLGGVADFCLKVIDVEFLLTI